jgi:glycosyltransferase involved in cell wall biosynthesis
MKVLFLTTYVTREQAGAAQAAYALANHVSCSKQAEVTLACDRFEQGILEENITVLELKEPKPLPALWRIGAYLRPYRLAAGIRSKPFGKFDIVYTADVDHALACAQLYKSTPIFLHAGAIISSREILTEGGTSLVRRLQARAEDRSVRRALKQKNIAHLVSTPLAARERATFYGVDKSMFEIAPYGVDQNRFAYGAPYKDIRSALGIPGEAFVVCTTARLVEWKGIDLLLKAAHRCVSRPSVLIVGDGPEMSRLQALASGLDIKDRVRFVGYAEPNAYLAASDLFVLPSAIESFGLAYAEAMTMGLPCIGRRYRPPHVISSASDVIPDSAGFVIADEHELAAKIDLLAGDRSLCRKMGAAARRHSQENYTTAAYFDRIKRITESRFGILQGAWKP